MKKADILFFFNDLKRERELSEAKMRAAGYDPARLLLSARFHNWCSRVRRAAGNTMLFWRIGVRDITEPSDVYRRYA